MSPQPAYVNYGSRVSAPPPVECSEGRFLGLLVDGDEGAVRTLLDAVLNKPANGKVEYRPLTSHMFVLAGAFDKISSQAPGFEDWGSVSEAHLSIWVPLVAGKNEGGEFVPDHFCVWLPYIFVDNPLSYAGGREDYGYPKAMGRFKPETGLGDPMVLEVFGGDFGPGKQANWVKLLELSRGPAPAVGKPAGALALTASAPAARAALAGDWLPSKELVPQLLPAAGADVQPLAFGFSLTDILNEILSKLVRQVSLKQLRDANSADEACYQVILEAQVKATELTWQLDLNQWNIKIETLESHPLHADLGLTNGCEASLALNLRLGMVLKPGEVLAP